MHVLTIKSVEVQLTYITKHVYMPFSGNNVLYNMYRVFSHMYTHLVTLSLENICSSLMDLSLSPSQTTTRFQVQLNLP